MVRTLPVLKDRLKKDDLDAEILHGRLENEERDAVVAKFKEGKIKMLIATDVIAKGFNVPEVSVVVNFDIPCYKGVPQREHYLHRIGRAGRFGRNGVAINLVDSNDIGTLEQIEEPLKMKSKELPRDNLDPIKEVLTKVERKLV